VSRRSGLGRGLGALIPSDLVGESAALQDLPVASIEPNRFQPREHFDDEALSALSDSIRELGVLQPILVRPLDDERFELVAGERRWRAARRAGLSTIPALVRTVGDTTSLQQALVENLQRENLTALEEAAAYQQLLEDFDLTQEQVAARVGRSRSAVANTIRLLQLPAAVQRLIAEARLSPGHARALLASPDRSLQEQLARLAVAEGLTVRQLEERVRQSLLRDQEPPATPPMGASAPSTGASTPTALPDVASAPPEVGAAVDALEASDEQPVMAREGTAAGPIAAPLADIADEEDPAPLGAVRSSSGATAGAPAPEASLPPAGLLELEQLLGDYFETTVRVSSGRSRGRITIDFADLADLERIYRLIVHDT
jgi:ParB family transcriptional regulator, chromosome partitioning protein